jgi:hypothetical protein
LEGASAASELELVCEAEPEHEGGEPRRAAAGGGGAVRPEEEGGGGEDEGEQGVVPHEVLGGAHLVRVRVRVLVRVGARPVHACPGTRTGTG